MKKSCIRQNKVAKDQAYDISVITEEHYTSDSKG